jgi:hypothetical protein
VFFRISLSFLAILYEGAFLLLIMGLMGMPGLCIFSSAFNVGGKLFFVLISDI